ncbi:hypothetical protein KJ855_04235 [Patescibacteria group bacterium]|nr:hypothetical protein [Patescibacteria group bacterium]
MRWGFYRPHDDIRKYNPEYNQGAEEEMQKCLEGIHKCQETGKPFKMISQEMRFYINHDIPLPRVIPRRRHQNRLSLRNIRKLHHRQCMCEEGGHGHEGRCKTEFETTYSPDRSEKVYCEGCYQKSVV